MNSSRSTRPLSPPTSFIRAPLMREVEDPRVGRVDQMQADDLADLGLGAVLGLAVGQHHVAESAHGGERRPGAVEGRDLPLLDQDVVERDRQLTVDRRPVARVLGLDDDPRVEAHLLGEVLADVGVVPVEAGVGELEPVGELAAVRDRRLGLLGDAVEAVLQPQPVPVQGRVDVAEVGRLDRDLAVLVDVQCRPGNRAVVAEHPDLGVVDPLAHRLDRRSRAYRRRGDE